MSWYNVAKVNIYDVHLSGNESRTFENYATKAGWNWKFRIRPCVRLLQCSFLCRAAIDLMRAVHKAVQPVPVHQQPLYGKWFSAALDFLTYRETYWGTNGLRLIGNCELMTLRYSVKGVWQKSFIESVYKFINPHLYIQKLRLLIK